MPRALNGKKSEPDIERREQDILDRRADAAWEYRSRNREAVNARARLRMRRRREELQTAPAAVRLEKEAKARQYRRNYRERNRPVPRPVKSASPTKAAKTSETRTKMSKATTTDHAKSSHASRDKTPALRRSERGLFEVAPPAGFEPCEISKYLGANFKDHLTFSRVRNKTYWILFSGPNQGVYSLKVTCLAAKKAADNEEDVIGALETWEEVLRAWAAHCFHRHGKCAIHTQACVSGRCAAHAPSARAGTSTTIKVVRVKREAIVKIEPGVKLEAGVKQENTLVTAPRPATAPRPKRTVERAAPPSYTPIPETDSDSDGLPAGSAPLFDPDSPESAPPARLPSYDPDAPRHPLESLAHRHPLESLAPTRPARVLAGLNLGLRELQVSRVASRASRESRDADAFKQVGTGPVQVVLGWEAATKYARELVEEAEVEVENGKGDGKGKGKASGGMDIDS
ncbi:hypothetical protein C8R47DRAFT_1084569 [Mycena vitilis]|nr:hypothetical protein C8R47DRAFT_1084569 [Mycena vitilis]